MDEFDDRAAAIHRRELLRFLGRNVLALLSAGLVVASVIWELMT